MLELDWNTIIPQVIDYAKENLFNLIGEGFSDPTLRIFWIIDIIMYSSFVLMFIGSRIYDKIPSYKKY